MSTAKNPNLSVANYKAFSRSGEVTGKKIETNTMQEVCRKLSSPVFEYATTQKDKE